MAPLVVIRDLAKEYPGRRAPDGITLEIEEGEIYGLIGHNGAGKTTALGILPTIIKPTSESAEIFGKNVGCQGGRRCQEANKLPA
jgi:ABC-2 type transport system ATP-binding protein